MGWVYGESKYQRFYELDTEKGHICVFENKWGVGHWLASIDWSNGGGNCMLQDKKATEKAKRKSKAAMTVLLSSYNPEYMKEKALYCLNHHLSEVD